jgi:hypothetical protein
MNILKLFFCLFVLKLIDSYPTGSVKEEEINDLNLIDSLNNDYNANHKIIDTNKKDTGLI